MKKYFFNANSIWPSPFGRLRRGTFNIKFYILLNNVTILSKLIHPRSIFQLLDLLEMLDLFHRNSYRFGILIFRWCNILNKYIYMKLSNKIFKFFIPDSNHIFGSVFRFGYMNLYLLLFLFRLWLISIYNLIINQVLNVSHRWKSSQLDPQHARRVSIWSGESGTTIQHRD
jgi:hypothetical protein